MKFAVKCGRNSSICRLHDPKRLYLTGVHMGKLVKLVKLVKLNNLEYNPNRDPAVYRRVPKKPFRIQALLDGQGQVEAHVEVDGKAYDQKKVTLPDTYTSEISFATSGVRVATLIVKDAGGAERFRQDLRLDVLDHAWIG